MISACWKTNQSPNPPEQQRGRLESLSRQWSQAILAGMNERGILNGVSWNSESTANAEALFPLGSPNELTNSGRTTVTASSKGQAVESSSDSRLPVLSSDLLRRLQEEFDP